MQGKGQCDSTWGPNAWCLWIFWSNSMQSSSGSCVVRASNWNSKDPGLRPAWLDLNFSNKESFQTVKQQHWYTAEWSYSSWWNEKNTDGLSETNMPSNALRLSHNRCLSTCPLTPGPTWMLVNRDRLSSHSSMRLHHKIAHGNSP